MDETTFCEQCGIRYCPELSDDVRYHNKFHAQVLKSFETAQSRSSDIEKWTFCQQRVPAELENRLLYTLLNSRNPNLHGFKSWLGDLTETDRLALTTNSSVLPVATGTDQDGHDRFGEWAAPSGLTYTFQLNWRAGVVDFQRTV